MLFAFNRLNSIRTVIRTAYSCQLNQSRSFAGKSSGNRFPLETFVESVKRYKDIYGDSWINSNFVVPSDSEKWPKEMHGLELGKLTSRFRKLLMSKQFKHNIYESMIGKTLDELGFVVSGMEQRNLVILNALLVYYELFQTFDVPRTFVIPDTPMMTIAVNKEEEIIVNPFPRACWGMSLGFARANLKREGQNSYPLIRQYLNQAGFCFDLIRPKYSGDLVCEALTIFYERYKHCDVSQQFAFDTNDMSIREELRGMKLGLIVRNIRHYGHYKDYREKFEELGLRFETKTNSRANQ